LSELRKVTEKDGIHFTLEEYQNLADRCTACLKALLTAEKGRKMFHCLLERLQEH
jgi:hypothetical protein